MNGLGENYLAILNFYNRFLTEYSSFRIVIGEIKQWLINERENKPNPIQFNELTVIIKRMFEFGNKCKETREIIECNSFNLNVDLADKLRSKLAYMELRLSLNSVSQISHHLQLIDRGLIKLNEYMKSTYTPNPYNVLLSNFSEKIFRNKTKIDISILKDRINQLRFTAPNDERINRLLKNMLQNLVGLEITQNHIVEHYQNWNFNEPGLDLHVNIRGFFIKDLRELKKITLNEDNWSDYI